MSKIQTFAKKTGLALAAAGTSVSAFAGDYTADITAAATEANANQVLVVGSVIALAVIGFGVARMLGFLGK